MNSSSLNWVVAQLKPNMLKKAESNLLRQSIQYYAPQKEYTIRKGNLFKRVKKLLFPGYIFVKINPNNQDVSILGNTLGVARVLKSSIGKAATLPESFVENLRKISDTEFGMLIKQDFKKGVNVKCINGPFTGLIGQIHQIDETGRLKILFKIIENSFIGSININSVVLE